MIDANSQFFAILTNVGMAKQANADALGIPWKITEMGVGDANGTDPIPSAAQTKLISEWRRRPLNQLKVDPVNPAVLIAEQIIPADEGGKWIREIGLYDIDGDLVAVANCAPSFKPILSQGSGRTQIVRMNFIVTGTGNITLKIDPSIVLASRSYVDAAILEVLAPNKTAGEFTRVKVNDRGVVVSGDTPSTLAEPGIKDSYTKAEIESIVARSSALPVGALVAFPRSTVPAGFLEVDGSVQSIAAYPDLAAYLGIAFNTGGEGPGNFRLPESRGEFLRGWDHGRGADAGRAIGAYQAAGGAVMGIEGRTSSSAATIAPFNVTVPADGSQTPWLNTGDAASVADVDLRFSLNGSAVRPRNLAVMWCLKAWSAPINQGNIDVAALVSELDALKAAVPVGSIVPFPKAAVPPGYLELDGSAQIITAYPALAAYLGTTYNNGTEPAGYFRLPDARGEFLRGWDHGRGADAGRTIGSWQKGTFHNIGGGPSPDAVTDFSASTGSLSYQDLGLDDCSLADYPNARYGYATSPGAVGVPVRAEQNYGVMRPRNLAVMWCIKAWNAPVNQGSIDVAALAASIANLPLLGFGQTWQNVTANRVSGTVYTNTTGRPIVVSCYSSPAATNNLYLTVAGVVVAQNVVNNATSGANSTVSAIVPPGVTYSVTATPSPIAVWSELRA